MVAVPNPRQVNHTLSSNRQKTNNKRRSLNQYLENIATKYRQNASTLRKLKNLQKSSKNQMLGSNEKFLRRRLQNSKNRQVRR